jgi:protein tyrosine phosphatase (PTP) superfamily phosphohydrolase (DUF442 family)
MSVTGWVVGAAIVALLTAGPYYFYRYEYTRTKRLRVVEPGVLYRSGQMTAAGFEEAVQLYGIRTVVNLQDDYPDPLIALDPLGRHRESESELCRRLGVKYVFIAPDLLPRRRARARHELPAAIDQFLAVMDDPSNHPVLIHCKAGLHRTGVITAVYRMEYAGWSPREAMAELLAQGFGRFKGVAANDYIQQYVLNYLPRSQRADRVSHHPPCETLTSPTGDDCFDCPALGPRTERP